MSEGAIAVIRPEPIPFVSYPYEWSFSQLKDAALLTIAIQKRAIARGMSLKDASAYNIQFLRGRPIFIDTLSFERYREGEPWVAYGQFCRHFLAPLALMARVDARLGGLLKLHLDGVPLDLAARLLPSATRLQPGLLAHIHVHARAQRGDARPGMTPAKAAHLSKTGLLALIDSLEATVAHLSWEPKNTEWAEYYTDTNYDAAAMADKRRLVAAYIDDSKPEIRTCWDLGANDGSFSKLAAEAGYYTIAMDSDLAAVEKAYLDVRGSHESNVLPLIVDLTNPSPMLGWANAERDSLLDRGPAGLALSLALIHHLAIGNNVPLPLIAEFFARVGEYVICEFVPKGDSQVARLLRSREDIFDGYHEAGFEAAMSANFELLRSEAIPGTVRRLYLFRRR
ncbi:MAG TPA: hypothetical protein VKT78_19510 [Fimbriimonadaceae bacterium]|nr:hypothetical protein [Fimbriimonadaceae bacterium]